MSDKFAEAVNEIYEAIYDLSDKDKRLALELVLGSLE